MDLFYKDYTNFQNELWHNVCKNTLIEDKISMFKGSKKLLDRFLFVFFAEDNHLLPSNSILRVVKHYEQLTESSTTQSLYDVFKQYFHYINIGCKGNVQQDSIFAYGGSLFKKDSFLDDFIIDSDLLKKHVLILSTYDFQNDINVDVLGYIFEHYLDKIESIAATFKGQEVKKSKSKRKRDGVFYTPKYITEYIVENTVGKLCKDKKYQLRLIDKEYVKGNQTRSVIKKLDVRLNAYRDWLLNIKICDPACGSGAFLNQALEFLLQEHTYVDELNTLLQGTSIVHSNIKTHILKHNLYGVDINAESVEITKLSLWLRTAQKGRKLISLDGNIVCGNSLIADFKIAGEKAFNWQHKFPEVFVDGGFDVIIGNPPYVSANNLKKGLTKEAYQFLKKNFVTAKGTVDLYIYFFEQGIRLLKDEGCLAYITPNRFLSASYGIALREFILKTCEMYLLVDYSDKSVFPNVKTYPVITFLKHSSGNDYNVISGTFDDTSKQFIGKTFPSTRLKIIKNNILGFLLNDKLSITEKIINQSESLTSVGQINATSTAKEADEYSNLINEEYGLKLINTGTIDPYVTFWNIRQLTNKGAKYLKPRLPLSSVLISKNRYTLYSSPKIIIAKIGLRCEAFYDKTGQFASINTNCIHSFSKEFLPEYVLCWINSKLYNYLFECLFEGLRMSGGYLLYTAPNLRSTYIKQLTLKQQELFIEKANVMMNINNDSKQQTDEEINHLIYKLYNLTDKEIVIVENN